MKSVYIHIPFCNTICTYCDFCKMFYNNKWSRLYLEELSKEIDSRYNGEMIDTIYIGGGTPNCLSLDELEYLFNIISKIKKSNNYEYTLECNVELITEEQVILMKKYGINRVSIGVQTFNDKFLKFLNRHHNKDMVIDKINLLKKYGFKNINIDLMYALPGESLDDLRNDINLYKSLDIPHISTYSLILEPNTILYNENVKNINEDLDRDMYDLIIKELNDYNHYETSNFALKGYKSRHNLTYWDNNHYYGFGLGASGYIGSIRYDNTKGLNNYLKGNYIKDEEVLSKNEIIENEFILGFRKINGININDFMSKYNIDMLQLDVVKKLIKEGKLINTGSNIRINDNYIYTASSILIDFLGVDYEK